MWTTKRLDVSLLARQLLAAGLTRRIGTYDNDNGETWVHTYDEDGQYIDLPPAAQAVLDAHVAPDPPLIPDYGADVPEESLFQQQKAQAVSNLRAYLALDTPTAAQTRDAVRLVVRVVLYLLRRTE